jgi:hypothetical protein
MQNRAEPHSLQPEKQEKVQSETALFFRRKAKVTYKETWVDGGSSTGLEWIRCSFYAMNVNVPLYNDEKEKKEKGG